MAEAKPYLRTEHYTEGVVLGADGTLFFSQTTESTISAVPATGDAPPAARVWAHVPGANGHAIAADGTHVVMASAGAFVGLDEAARIVREYATQADGEPLVYPNGVALDPHRGGFYATDSGYTSMPQHIEGKPKGRVVRVEADGAVRVVADGIAYANGVGLSPDGRTLYVTASVTSRIHAYRIDDRGTLAEGHVLAVVPTVADAVTVPDGLTVDTAGFLYVAHYGAREVLVYTPNGALARRLPAGNRCTSHVALDERRRRAFVSGGLENESGPGAIFELTLG